MARDAGRCGSSSIILITGSHNVMILFKVSGAKEANPQMNLLDYKHGWLGSYCGSRVENVACSPKDTSHAHHVINIEFPGIKLHDNPNIEYKLDQMLFCK